MAIIEMKLPDIGNFDEVEVIDVLVKPGDTITVDQSLLTLESDKASMDVPANSAGTIIDVLVKVGEKVKEGTLIFRIEAASTEAQPQPEKQPDEQTHTPETTQQTILTAEPPQITAPPHANPVSSARALDPTLDIARAHASPSVRALARELGADLNQIQGTGPKNRILREDVVTFVHSLLTDNSRTNQNIPGASGLNLLPWPKIDFTQFGEITRAPLSRIRKISGANLSRNWAMIPHVTQFDECDITELESFRVTLNDENKNEIKVTMLAFLVKAAANALKIFPEFNSALDGDDLILKQYYHIGFAVDTPDGLVVPVIRDCDRKGVREIASEMTTLALLAREGKLKLDQMQGGCFTISSLGGIGGTAFTPIINAPEVAILGVSRSALKPVWNGKEFTPRLMLPLSLSYDHRVIDGASAARFIAYLNKTITDLRRILL